MTSGRRLSGVAWLPVLALSAATASWGQSVDPPTDVGPPPRADLHLEIFAGLSSSTDELIDEEELYGVRGGYDFGEEIGLELSGGQFEDGAEQEVEIYGVRRVRLQVFQLDASLVWRPRGGRFLLFAGPGVVDIDLEIFGEDSETIQVSTTLDLSWHAGVAYRWEITPGFYLRFDLRGRVGDTENYDLEDSELTLAAGWKF